MGNFEERRKEVEAADEVVIDSRVLYRVEPSPKLLEGIIKEISPLADYVRMERIDSQRKGHNHWEKADNLDIDQFLDP